MLLEYLNKKGKKEFDLLNNLTKKYSKIIHSINQRIQEFNKENFSIRRSERLAANIEKKDKEKSFMTYHNYYKE